MDGPQVLIREPMLPETIVEMRQIIQGITRARWKVQEEVGCQESFLMHKAEAGRLLYEVCKEIGLTAMQMCEALGAHLVNEIIFDELHSSGTIGDDLEFPPGVVVVDPAGEGWRRLR